LGFDLIEKRPGNHGSGQWRGDTSLE
jgi:hypothetical protein